MSATSPTRLSLRTRRLSGFLCFRLYQCLSASLSDAFDLLRHAAPPPAPHRRVAANPHHC
jgi:hypothetical protein